MYSRVGVSNSSNQKVGQGSKNIQRVGQMAIHNKPNQIKPSAPTNSQIQDQINQYNKYK